MNPRKTIPVILALLLALACAPAVFAHCQIPCGIYGDPARFDAMSEHVTTLEKSMNMIDSLGKAESPNWNQLVRWIDNKDDHADQLMEIVTQYFMAQRIKPAEPGSKGYDKYVEELTLLHKIMVHAMKAKQTTDQEHIEALRKLIHDLRHSYLGEEK